MDNHPFGDGAVFQIDGNFGAVAAIAEMLLQADENRVLLLPALPSEWADGRMTGLVVPGGDVVDLFWSEGKLQDCVVKTDKPYQGTFLYHSIRRQVSLQEGQSLHLQFK